MRKQNPRRNAKDAEWQREYRKSQPERARANAKAYRQSHKKEIAAYQREYRARHRREIAEYQREYRRKHGAPTTKLARRIGKLLEDPEMYILQVLNIQLRPYQAEPLSRILESIEGHLGDSFVLIFPRQAGKDEFLIDLKLYLADLYSVLPVSMVEVNPTYQPQTAAAVQRFDQAAQANLLTRGQWRAAGGFTRQIGQLSVRFLSGDKQANVAGASASLLLVINEAQDIPPEVYARKFEPMAASTNATRIFAGTAWTSRTLLAQEKRAAIEAERVDGRRRLFTVDAEAVGACVPWYAAHVEAAIHKHGRQHPLIKTQYFNEEIDAQSGMFNARRRALMAGDAAPPGAGGPSVFCIDVAGQDEAAVGTQGAQDGLGNPGRDATTLSIISVDLSSLESLQAPTFRVVQRRQWVGTDHLTVFGQLKALAGTWQPLHIAVDATGVGEGLWAMLNKAFRTRVIPVKFSAQKKSEMGYRFISLIEAGRFKDCSFAAQSKGKAWSAAAAMADEEYAACTMEILTGPQKTMRWGVPDGTRNASGELIHDDIVIADALITEVDALEWHAHSPTLVVRPRDPLEEMSRFRE
jgi:hypothetical protein